MRIIIDVDEAGHQHFVDTDRAVSGTVADPTNPTQQIDILTLLSRMNGRRDLQEAGGWLITNQCPWEDAPKTRWQRLVDEINTNPLAAPLRALNLK